MDLLRSEPELIRPAPAGWIAIESVRNCREAVEEPLANGAMDNALSSEHHSKRSSQAPAWISIRKSPQAMPLAGSFLSIRTFARAGMKRPAQVTLRPCPEASNDLRRCSVSSQGRSGRPSTAPVRRPFSCRYDEKRPIRNAQIAFGDPYMVGNGFLSGNPSWCQ